MIVIFIALQNTDVFAEKYYVGLMLLYLKKVCVGM